jgi:HK97 family phage major capsid protein
MAINIKALQEQRNELLNELETLCNSVEVEKRTINKDEETIICEKMKAVDDIDRTIQIENKRRSFEDFAPQENFSEDEQPNKEEKNFLSFVKNKDASALDVSTNGAVIPKSIANRIIARVYELCPILELATVVHVKGELSVPVYDDTTDVVAGYVEDLTELTSNVGKFDSITLGNYIFGSLAIVSKSLLNNTDFDLLSYIIDRVALGFSKVLSKEGFVGSEKIVGLFSDGAVANTTSVTKLDDSALITIQNSIPTEYQANSVWLMNRSTLLKCKLLKDANGRSLLNPDLTQGYGWSILGQKVYLDMNIPDDTLFYGDLSGYWFKFSQDLEINVLYEQFALKHAVGVYGYAELDGKPIEQQKLAVLTVSSSK